MEDQIREQMIGLLPRLRRFAWTLTGQDADADDLVQATCVKAMENLDKWQINTRLDSWMYRIAQNIHRNNLRHQRVKSDYATDLEHIQTEHVDGEKAVSQQDELQHVGRKIDRLPADQKTVLLLVAVEGYGYQEAADILDVPVGTITSRLGRARQNLSKE